MAQARFGTDEAAADGTPTGGHLNVISAGEVVIVEPQPQPDFRRGHSNSDRDLDISDGLYTLGWLFSGTGEPDGLDAADANDSGEIDISDAVYVFGYLFSGGPAPLPPGPDVCGPDPTVDDNLGCLNPHPDCI